MEIRQLRETEMEEALQLVWEVFCAFEAPVYSAQGVEEFRSFLQNREEMARQQFFGAWEGGRLIGVLATSGPHISLFFVRREWHRRGVGRALHNRMEAAASTGQPFQKNRNGVQAGAYSLGRRLFCAMLSQRFFPSRPLAFAASPFFQRAFLRLPCKKAYLPRIFSEAFSPYSRLENL